MLVVMFHLCKCFVVTINSFAEQGYLLGFEIAWLPCFVLGARLSIEYEPHTEQVLDEPV